AGVQADPVALVYLERGHDSVLLDRAVAADDLDVVRRAVAAAGEGPRRVPVSRVRAREEAAVRADPVLDHDPLAAAPLAFAAGLVAQREAVDEEAVARLCPLGRA